MNATPAKRDASYLATGFAAPKKVETAGADEVALGVVTGVGEVVGLGVVTGGGVGVVIVVQLDHSVMDDGIAGVGTDDVEAAGDEGVHTPQVSELVGILGVVTVDAGTEGVLHTPHVTELDGTIGVVTVDAGTEGVVQPPQEECIVVGTVGVVQGVVDFGGAGGTVLVDGHGPQVSLVIGFEDGVVEVALTGCVDVQGPQASVVLVMITGFEDEVVVAITGFVVVEVHGPQASVVVDFEAEVVEVALTGCVVVFEVHGPQLSEDVVGFTGVVDGVVALGVVLVTVTGVGVVVGEDHPPHPVSFDGPVP